MSERQTRHWVGILSGYGLPLLAFAGAVVTAFLISHDAEHGQSARNVAVAIAIIALLTALFQHFRDVEGDRQAKLLEKLSKENVELNKALQSMITGGNSFLMAYFPLVDGKHWLTFRHFGEEPLDDIRVEVTAFDPHRTLAAFVYPSMLAGTTERLRPFVFNVQGRGALQVSFQALNGWWAETVIFMRNGGELLFALRAWRIAWKGDGTSERTILREEVHPRFPRGPSGEIDWSVAKPIESSNLMVSTEPVEASISRNLGMA